MKKQDYLKARLKLVVHDEANSTNELIDGLSGQMIDRIYEYMLEKDDSISICHMSESSLSNSITVNLTNDDGRDFIM